jgi:hypothetical protein
MKLYFPSHHCGQPTNLSVLNILQPNYSRVFALAMDSWAGLSNRRLVHQTSHITHHALLLVSLSDLVFKFETSTTTSITGFGWMSAFLSHFASTRKQAKAVLRGYTLVLHRYFFSSYWSMTFAFPASLLALLVVPMPKWQKNTRSIPYFKDVKDYLRVAPNKSFELCYESPLYTLW